MVSLIVRTFAKSNRGIRRKDDNLYGSQSRFEPQIYKPSLFGTDGFVLICIRLFILFMIWRDFF